MCGACRPAWSAAPSSVTLLLFPPVRVSRVVLKSNHGHQLSISGRNGSAQCPPGSLPLGSRFVRSSFSQHVLDKSLPCDTFRQKRARPNEPGSFLMELPLECTRSSDVEHVRMMVAGAVHVDVQHATAGAGLPWSCRDAPPREMESRSQTGAQQVARPRQGRCVETPRRRRYLLGERKEPQCD